MWPRLCHDRYRLKYENAANKSFKHAAPGFVSFLSDVPGPRDEVLAQVGDDRVSAHHLRTEDVAEDTFVIVEVDGQQLSL